MDFCVKFGIADASLRCGRTLQLCLKSDLNANFTLRPDPISALVSGVVNIYRSEIYFESGPNKTNKHHY
jgi:hypothetical protein